MHYLRLIRRFAAASTQNELAHRAKGEEDETD